MSGVVQYLLCKYAFIQQMHAPIHAYQSYGLSVGLYKSEKPNKKHSQCSIKYRMREPTKKTNQYTHTHNSHTRLTDEWAHIFDIYCDCEMHIIIPYAIYDVCSLYVSVVHLWQKCVQSQHICRIKHFFYYAKSAVCSVLLFTIPNCVCQVNDSNCIN